MINARSVTSLNYVDSLLVALESGRIDTAESVWVHIPTKYHTHVVHDLYKHACENQHLDIIKWAVSKGADVRALLDPHLSQNAAHILCDQPSSDTVSILAYLKEQGLDLNAVDIFGCTALHAAAIASEWPNLYPQLVDWGADENILTAHDQTPKQLRKAYKAV